MTVDEPAQPGGIARNHRPARGQKTAMNVAQRIVAEISSKGYVPGTRLPNEKEMLEQYGVARGTLRESLRFLEMNGVLFMKPGFGGGPVVGEPDARDLAGTLALFLQAGNTPFAQILQVRVVLEPIIAGLAAEHRSEENAAEIRASVESMAANLGSEEHFLLVNERFHELVAWASGNSVLALLVSSLHWITDASILGVQYPERSRKRVLEEHRIIAEAIAAHDAIAASSAMTHHIVDFARYLGKHYPNVVNSKVRWSGVTS